MTENAKKLIEALRSGRYEQTGGRLRRGDTYCCLGVACDISGLGEWSNDRDHPVYIVPNEQYPSDVVLPPAVAEWLGFYSTEGASQGGSLTAKNDGGWTFREIADLIEAEPKGLFA